MRISASSSSARCMSGCSTISRIATRAACPPARRRGASTRRLALTDYLVRATLGPLVDGRDAAAILSLRVLDPAMGSGAFLVVCLRFLAGALERALIVDGTFGEHGCAEPDRAHFRRLVAQRCLFGVDANPMAVQLAELSLWLATLAAKHPISFLEHHLRRGDSLIGVRPADVMRQPPGGRRTGVNTAAARSVARFAGVAGGAPAGAGGARAATRRHRGDRAREGARADIAPASSGARPVAGRLRRLVRPRHDRRGAARPIHDADRSGLRP